MPTTVTVNRSLTATSGSSLQTGTLSVLTLEKLIIPSTQPSGWEEHPSQATSLMEEIQLAILFFLYNLTESESHGFGSFLLTIIINGTECSQEA